MELWDLYTRHRVPTGQTHVRGNPLPVGCFHLVVHVWIRNAKGEYLISQRAADRQTFPLLWETVGGAVLAGETSLQGALREAKEEIGIDLQPGDGQLLFTKIRGVIDGGVFQDIVDIWQFSYDGPLDLKNAVSNEVKQCRFMTKAEILTYFQLGQFVHTLQYFSDAIDAPEKEFHDVLGKTVSCIIDRPIGSYHPKYPDIQYPVNYGYVRGVIGGDGEEQDVYILGVPIPCTVFCGQIIAVYHRFNDTEDKWIAAPEGFHPSADEILGEIAFQEQYFHGKLYRI